VLNNLKLYLFKCCNWFFT